jgi:REP-associated tyrosine transposase
MRRIRLPLDTYAKSHVWHLTLHTAGGIAPFENAALVESCVKLLKLSAQKYSVRIYAYCFMPNHLHLLAHNEKGDDLLQFVRHFKQITGFAFKRTAGVQLWQSRFYDRALRSDDDLTEVAEYIIGNPVTDGFVSSPEQFPFLGSFEWSLFDE